MLFTHFYLPVLRQAESVLVQLFAEPAHVVANVIFDFGQLGFRLLGHLHHIERWIDVPFSHHQMLVWAQLSDDGARNGGTVIFVKVEFADCFAFLRVRGD